MRAGRRPKKRKKNPNALFQRKSAHLQLKALDGVLRQRTGRGLEALDPAIEQRPVSFPPPTLVLHMDEASTNVTMVYWMQYAAGLRVLFTRDPFHRYWNDAKAALVQVGQYWAVLLCRVVFNLPYGPWDGKAWWEKMVQQVGDMVFLLPVDGPIWGELYPRVCLDHGETPTWTHQHKAAILQRAAFECTKAKLERMAINRWLSYVSCSPKHLPQWHSRCLLALMIGMRDGTYRDRKEFALWEGPAASKRVPQEEGEQEEAEDREFAGAIVADTTAAAASSTGSLATGSTAQKSVVWGEADLQTRQVPKIPCSWQGPSCHTRLCTL